jgi:putative DNA primase/helicase
MSEKNQSIVIESPAIYPETIELKAKGADGLPMVKVLDTHVNLRFLLNRLNATVKYNRMTRKREIVIPAHYFFDDDLDNDALAKVEYIATINFMPTKNIDKWLDVLAGESPYHPIVDCIDSKPWDGVPRLDTFINTLTTSDPERDKKVIKIWMTAACAAAYSVKGFVQNGVLVLQGKQGEGKTSWARSLDPAQCGAVKTGALLDPKKPDSLISLSRFWLVELGELDGTFNKTDIAHLKSYITSDADDVRAPYARKETHMARRTAYLATVNDSNFLVDTTGNRRWWTIVCTKINFNHGMDMQQVWAEVKDWWQKGGLTYLPLDLQESIDLSNRDHEKIDPLKEKLLTWYDWSPVVPRKWMTASAVLEEMHYLKPSHGETIRLGRFLAEKNGKQGKRSHGITYHEVPTKIIFRNNENNVGG